MTDSDDSTILTNISSKFSEENLLDYLKLSSGNQNIKLVKYETGGGTNKGDCYLSTVTRLKVEGVLQTNNKKHSLAIIVKGLPENIARRKTFKIVDFFRNESAFYNEVVPRFSAFQEKRKPKKPFTAFPRCFQALADGENDFIVMEDLSHSGYMAPKRQEGLDIEHCTKVLEILGRFHALSLAMKDQDPEELKKAVDSLQETYYKPENRAWYSDQMDLLSDVAIDAVSKELPGTVYEEKLKHFTSHGLYDRMIELVKGKEPYSVISHGDAWTPNFLFKYKSGNSHPESACVIDFQLARYSSPALDLSFFLYSCSTKELRDSHYNDLLGIYHQSLCEFLIDLGSPPDVFPYKNFLSEVAAYFTFGFGMSLESIPFSLIDDSETPSIDSIEGNEAIPLTDIWVVHPIKSKSGRLRMAHNVMHAVDNGFI